MKFNNTLKFVIIVLVVLIGFKSQAQTNSPVDIKAFQVEVSGDRLLINWSTASEDDANYFEIEKSLNGQDFKTYAMVLGPDPQKSANDYGYFDKINKKKSNVSYRIKHVDLNGNTSYSEIRSVQL